MAAKKIVRGAALVKKATEAAAATLTAPEPVPAGILKKLRLPNDEKLPAGLKAFLAFDVSSLGWEFDEDEPEFEPMALDELVAQVFSDDAVPCFGEAVELLGDDCLLFEQDGEEKSFLYVGSPEDGGEYPVISLAQTEEGSRVQGFVPFDVWIAQRFGVIPTPLPEEYAAVVKALAEANGDGRTSFLSEAREVAAGRDSDDEEDSDEE